MGIITMGPPEGLVLFLKDAFGILSFVETGTFKGSTAFWASAHFKTVHTIELSGELGDAAQVRFGQVENIEFVTGDSQKELPMICEKIIGPSLFWLDAHYCAGISAGAGERVPLLGEIRTIDQYAPNAFIMIDDARLIEMPPPEPHALDEYPSLCQTLNELNQTVPRYVAIMDDVIVAVPEECAPQVKGYLQRAATRKNQLQTEASTKSDYHKAFEHLVAGLSGSSNGLLRRLLRLGKSLWPR